MANFFKARNGKSKIVSEKPRLFRQIKEFRAQEALARLQSNIFQDRLFWVFFLVWLLALVLSLGYTLLNFSHLPNQIPLFYSQPWGENQLALKIYIFLPMAGVLVLGLFNFVFAAMFHLQDRVFSYLLVGAAALISTLSVITTFNIVNLMR